MLCFTNLCSTLMPRSMASLFVTAVGSSTMGVPITEAASTLGVFGAVDARERAPSARLRAAPVSRRHVSGRVAGGVGAADGALDPPLEKDGNDSRPDLVGDGAGVSNRTE